MKDVELHYSRDILAEGYDGKTCRVSPRAFRTPDGNTHILYGTLLLTGSDVAMGNYVISSADGVHFGEPAKLEPLPDSYENGIRTVFSLGPHYHPSTNSMYSIGFMIRYRDDKAPISLGEDNAPALQGKFDYKTMSFESCERLVIDTPAMKQYAHVIAMEPLDEEDGTVLFPIYCSTADNTKYQVLVVRFRVQDGRLIFVEHGRPIIRNDLERGVVEPRIAKRNGKYYLTLRSDEIGMLCESEDGLNYSELREWRWDDGSLLTSRNTQQAWLVHPDGLYLVYTRETSYNRHVFRRRAPLFMARFDEERGCLVRDTELIAVPEMGARLGNFTVTQISEREAWICVCEWMQTDPKVCESYGANNRLWRIRVSW